MINNENFTCSTTELRLLRIKLDTKTSVSVLDELLEEVQDLNGIYHCDFLQYNIMCDDSISQEIKDVILNFNIACPTDITCEQNNI